MRLRTTTVLIACVLCDAGCVPMTVADNPGARGRVVNRDTLNPIAGAKVCPKIRNERVPCALTNASGEFDLPPVVQKEWQFFMMENFPRYQRDVFTVTANGYASSDVRSLDYAPITVDLIPQ